MCAEGFGLLESLHRTGSVGEVQLFEQRSFEILLAKGLM